jgi:rod shape determining protein RodA
MLLTERRFRHFDFPLLIVTLLLVGLGILMIYSATRGPEGLGDNLLQNTAVRQAIYALVGFAGMLVLTFMDYRLFARWAWPIYAAVVALLAAIFVYGHYFQGAQRWFDLGLFRFQPSELSKLLLILVFAKFLAERFGKLSNWLNVAIAAGLILVPVALVYLEPDLGTGLVMLVAWFVMVLAAGMTWRQVAILAVVAIVLLPVVWLTLQPYQRERVVTFLNPESDPLGAGYNVTQAKIAIGSGGFWGRGILSGTQSQLKFLRIRQTDFIFSVIGEELGFWGGVFIIGALAFILQRLLRAAALARTLFGRLIALGIAATLFFQAFINIGMNLGLMPVTGIPLPFISAGGSSLITFLLAEGVVQSILIRHQELRLGGELELKSA